jgi:hypothetical protein
MSYVTERKMQERRDEGVGTEYTVPEGEDWEFKLRLGRSGDLYAYSRALRRTLVWRDVGKVEGVQPAPALPPQGALEIQDLRAVLPRDGQKVERRGLEEITTLVYHWDGGPVIPEAYVPRSYYISEAGYHIRKDWGGTGGDGLMYHYKVDRQGKVYQTRNLTDVVWAQTGANRRGLAVCFDATVGQEPTAAQHVAAIKLNDYFGTERPDLPMLHPGQVWGHGELGSDGNATSCPGDALRKVCQELRKTTWLGSVE